MPRFEIVEHQQLKRVRVVLDGDSVHVEAGALQHFRGDITVTVPRPTATGAVGSVLGGQSIARPVYTGTGEVYLGPPTFGEYVVLELRGETWVLEDGAYVCSDVGVTVGLTRNRGLTGWVTAESMFQTTVTGHGHVVLHTRGPIERVRLRDEQLAVDDGLAVARCGVRMTARGAAKGLLGTLSSGDGLIDVYDGDGVVLLVPVPNAHTVLAPHGVPAARGRSVAARSPGASLLFLPFAMAAATAMGAMTAMVGLLIR
ncbi:MAG: AIM24 family protein [Alphaproteobacteria bacterium]|nr:AIM24 family protein [Alphaproteobacteria bacterium]